MSGLAFGVVALLLVWPIFLLGILTIVKLVVAALRQRRAERTACADLPAALLVRRHRGAR